MPRLTIDGQTVEVPAGESLLQAAARLKIEIPTLCYLERCGPNTSCLVCLVKVKSPGSPRFVPACGTKAQPDMIVESETPEVHGARRTALELLFSDHVGDCLSPCHRICPLRLNVPLMIRQIEQGRLAEAAVTVRDALPLPSTLGRLCHHPCENGCRRGTWDQPAAIRELERYVADENAKATPSYVPACAPANGKSVAIVGAGPTGLAAADHLLRAGYGCTLVDRQGQAGGTLRAAIDDVHLSREAVEADLKSIVQLGARFMPGVELGRDLSLEGLLRGFDAVLLAIGEQKPGDLAALGLAVTAAGLRVDPATGLTSMPRIFAAGSAVKPVKQLVRALSEGRSVAMSIDACLSGRTPERAGKEFSSVMGRLEEGEIDLFVAGASPAGRTVPACGACAGFVDGEAHNESGRCLHCDCRAVGNCKLQQYAETYGANPNRFREQRRRFEQQLQHGEIIFEPGKCILCGICVRLAELASEPLGLTFIGRGFDVRVGAPMNHTIAEGLRKVAAECVEHCPTGALVFKDHQPVRVK